MPGQGLCRDMLGPNFVPQTPLRAEEAGVVKRPNRMSLLVAGRSDLFDMNESVLDAVTDSPVCSYTASSSPNPIGLVHRIADLQEALRKVTEELDSTKKSLQEERKRNKDGLSPTSISYPFDLNGSSIVYPENAKHILDTVAKITAGMSDLEETIKKQLCVSEASNYCGDINLSRISTISGASSTRNLDQGTSTETVRAETQLYSKRFHGSPTNIKAEASASLWCGHGTPEWCRRLKVGDFVDAKDKDRKWYKGIIADAKPKSEMAEKRCFKVHFMGWSDEWDLWMDEEEDLASLAPPSTHTDNRTSCAASPGSSMNPSGVKMHSKVKTDEFMKANANSGSTLSISMSPVAVSSSTGNRNAQELKK